MGIARQLLLKGSESRLLAQRLTRRPFVRRAVTRFMPGETADAALAAALSEGALGSGISGAGPSLFALCRSERGARAAAAAMGDAFTDLGLTSSARISPADCPGTRLI